MTDEENKLNEPNEEMPEEKNEAPAAEAEETASEKTKTSKKEKKSKASEAEDALKEQLAAQKDLYLRTLADFENFRRRSQKESEAAFGRGVQYAAKALIPAIDNLERALANVKTEEADGFTEGVKMTYKQMLSQLESVGITQIEALGEQFDPHYHEAVFHVDDEQYGDNEIVEVFQTGYIYNDETVIRPATVKVAN